MKENTYNPLHSLWSQCIKIRTQQQNNGRKFYFLLMFFPFYLYEVSFFVSFDQCKFDFSFVWYKYFYPCLFSGDFSLVNHLSDFHTEPLILFVNKVGLL
jgi:hypothetical protein